MELQNVKKTAIGILLFLILSGLCGCGSRPEDPVLPEQHKQQHQQEIEETEEEQNEEKTKNDFRWRVKLCRRKKIQRCCQSLT